MEAIKQFPKLLALADEGNLRIAYCPHSVHHAECRQAIAEYRQSIAENRQSIAEKDQTIARARMAIAIFTLVFAWQVLQKLFPNTAKGSEL